MSGLGCIRDIRFCQVKEFLNGDKRPLAVIASVRFSVAPYEISLGSLCSTVKPHSPVHVSKGLQTDYKKQFPDFIVARPTPVASRANIPADSFFPEGAASEGLSGDREMRFRPISRPENRH